MFPKLINKIHEQKLALTYVSIESDSDSANFHYENFTI
jgi:hypothetical protein